MDLQFSLIIPVYNRPIEIDELLNSLTDQIYNNFEVIVVEDGSTLKADKIAEKYSSSLNIKYFYKKNSGAGESRNFGMRKASGNYYIIFDSDCMIPPHYLAEVEKVLTKSYTDAYGGPDAAHSSFTTVQKAVNYSMTSFLTTGGLRGNKKAIDKFQPRSFNFGISKKAFEITQGFSTMKIGEDIDLTFRLWENNFETQFIEEAYVYHKRRTSFNQFFKQTFAFGKARPLLNKKYPSTAKITYWFPTFFLLLLITSMILMLFGNPFIAILIGVYLGGIFFDSLLKNKKISVALLSILTTITQFAGYGSGFLKGIFTY